MSKLLKSVCQIVSPNSPIVVDRYHIISFTNRVIDLCRVAVEKRLNERFQIKRLLLMKTSTFHKIKRSDNPKWHYKAKLFTEILNKHEEIRILWNLKNKIHGLYQCRKTKAILNTWNSIILFLDEHVSTHPEFADLKKTLLKWKKEILNYFVLHITNAYIEGLNNRIETLKRKKCGFRNKEKFIKALVYALFPITMFLTQTIFTH